MINNGMYSVKVALKTVTLADGVQFPIYALPDGPENPFKKKKKKRFPWEIEKSIYTKKYT